MKKQRQVHEQTVRAMYNNEITADETTNLIKTHVGSNKDLAIIDTTSCVGGNLFSFAKHYNNVLGIELDKNRYKMEVEKNNEKNTESDPNPPPPRSPTPLGQMTPCWGFSPIFLRNVHSVQGGSKFQAFELDPRP